MKDPDPIAEGKFYQDYGNPLGAIMREIQETIDRRNYFIALISVLSLIDICAALEARNGETNKFKFAKWFDENLKDYSNPGSSPNQEAIRLTGEECYVFRSRLLHQGRSRISKEGTNSNVKSGRLVFSIDQATIHRCNLEGNYFVDIPTFTKDVCDAVQNWRQHMETSADFKTNHAKLLRYGTEVPGSLGRRGHYLF